MESKEKLVKAFRSLKARGLVDQRIPDPEHNGNYDFYEETPEGYIKFHYELSCRQELPYLIKHAKLRPTSKIMDFGCGWARLAYAASNFLNAEGRYVGIDINEFAIAENKKCYAEYKNFQFIYQGVDINENYIYLSDNYTPMDQTKESSSKLKASETAFPLEFTKYFDLIFSHSVFTHMWKEAVVNVLKRQAEAINYNGICINSFFIVDEFARYFMKCGLSDRQLPYEINGALTLYPNNPLMCIAFRIQDIYEMYHNAGHEILTIEFGSWSGRKNELSYQDIVHSRPFQKT